jgi:hypothetical protein
MGRRKMDWTARGVARSRRGKLLFVLEVGRGASPNGPKLRLLVFGQAVGVCHDLGF